MALVDYALHLPKEIYSGKNAIEKISEVLVANKVRKAVIFTSSNLMELPAFKLVVEQVNNSSCQCEIIDDLAVEPTYQQVQEVIEHFKKINGDYIIACGGGSVMDAAKLTSILVTDEYGVKDLLSDPKRAKKTVPLMAIPTTAGTGAECTPNGIVGIPEKNTKMGIVNNEMIPDTVILDARFIEKLPRAIAASTGIDAMCHAIECYTSNKSNPFSDTFALEAFDMIMNHIEPACNDSTAMDDKNIMQIAAFYGGVAITASGTTAVHALSYPLGGRYHIAHGTSNAMLLIPVMKFNLQDEAFKEKMAKAWDKAYKGDLKYSTNEEKANALVEWMERIVRDLDIPNDLKQFGVDPKDLDELVEAGMQQQRLLVNNMKLVEADDARKIYLEVM